MVRTKYYQEVVLPAFLPDKAVVSTSWNHYLFAIIQETTERKSPHTFEVSICKINHTLLLASIVSIS